MKKMWWLALLLALPFVAAQGPLQALSGVWSKILSIGNLSFVQGQLVSLTRVLIWILTFALFFAVLGGLGAGKQEGRLTFLGRNQAMVVAGVLATISAIFLPAAAILAVGAGWATAVGLILIGTPVLGLGYVLWKIPGRDKDGNALPETKGTVIFKLLLSMLLFWILSAMNYSLQYEKGIYLGQVSVAGTMANFIAWALYITSIMIIYYIIKFFFTSSKGAEEAEKRWREGGKALGKLFSKKAEELKAGEESVRRAREVREPHSYLVEAIEDGDKLSGALSVRAPEERSAAVSKAEKHLKSLRKNLKKAVRSLRYLRRKERGSERARFYEIFDNLYTHAGVALTHAKNISLPKANANDQEWRSAYEAVRGTVGVIRGICGKIVNALNVFIEQELEAAQRAAAFQTAQHAEERAQRQEQQRETVRTRAEQQAQERRRRMTSRPVGVIGRRRYR